MERRTSERLVNLAIALLTAGRFVARESLREMVEGYQGLSDEAFQRQFERDKDSLRALGVSIETGTADRYFLDDTGYRVRRADFELPPVSFDDAEVGVLVSAAQVWQQASAAETTTAALAKLWAAGVEPDTDRLASLRPHISAREPAWQPVWDALKARRKVSFRYHGADRTVQPWGLAWRHGAWYMAGYDELRSAHRLFKLARLESDITAVGPAEAYEAPSASEDLWQGLEAPPPDASAVIDVRRGRAPWLTRRAQLVGDGPVGWLRWRLPYASGGPPDASVVGDLAMAGADVKVIEPAELARAVADHHAGLLARLGGVEGGGS